MRRLIHYALIALAGCLSACYGVEDENFKTLAPIEISGIDPIIYTKLNETLRLDQIKIETSNGTTPQIEWSYGSISGDFPKMADSTFISNKATLEAAFNKVGQYVLRLKVDNGESVIFNYYELRVQASFDEGILVLSSDPAENGAVTFIKKRTPQEEADNDQEIWDNLLTINPEYSFKKPRDIFFFSSGTTSGMLLTTADNDGSVYRFNPVTFEVTYRAKMEEEYATKPGLIFGEKTTRGHYCYIIGEDSRAYRYEMTADLLAVRTTPTPVTRGFQHYYATTSSAYRTPFMFNETSVVGFPNSGIKGYTMDEGYKILSAAGSRVGVEFYVVITQLATDAKQIRFKKLNAGISSSTTLSEYTSTGDIAMDKNSVMIGTKLNDNIYYNYGNKVYHWEISSISPSIPVVGSTPDILLPEGEQIISMCTNGMPTTSSTNSDDNQLIIATYNATVTGRKPGSVFIYDLKTMSKLKEYVGICEKPLKVAYKFLSSN